MNENEDYFRFTQDGTVHKLSDRIPFRWKELVIWTVGSFTLLFIFLGGVGIYVAMLTLVGYALYRLAAWFYFTEIYLDTESKKMIKMKKLLDRSRGYEVITEKFDPANFEFKELVRSGKTKYLFNYKLLGVIFFAICN